MMLEQDCGKAHGTALRMYDLIEKKKHGAALSKGEITEMVMRYVNGEIPDYQMSALLMAIYFKGMDAAETAALTQAMADSGDKVDLSAIAGRKVDKHSTGGVGDKTTLIAVPIVAACGGRVAKMSGRGLGHTGGTVDKLESIPGFRTSLSRQEFFDVVNACGAAVIGQTGNLVPADKKLYALRDVTATVDSIPLIASSIMSKKLAAGSDGIVLDVKTGSGAFMKTLDDAIALAQAMADIGELAGKRVVALVTDMDAPLGHAIGNAMEIIEAVNVLRGNGPSDLAEVSLQLASNMLVLAGMGDGNLDECRKLAERALSDGSALEQFCRMAELQGGDSSYLREPAKFRTAPFCEEVMAERDGFVTSMDAGRIGMASVILGAGRATKESTIDSSAGIMLCKKTGDAVRRGEPLARLYTSRQETLQEAGDAYRAAVAIGDARPAGRKLVYARVEYGKVERFA